MYHNKTENALSFVILIFNKDHNATLIYRHSFTVRHHICVVKQTVCVLVLFYGKIQGLSDLMSPY